jgi:AraC family transcriptional regulator
MPPPAQPLRHCPPALKDNLQQKQSSALSPTLVSMFLRTGGRTMKTVTLQDYKRRILRVLVHIQQHLDDALRLQELAALAFFSPYHFHRVFKGMTGESVKEYVRRLRLERAASRLKLGAASVTDIAFDAGYESHEAFTRSFHAVFGLSPSRFRFSHRNPVLGAAPSGLHYANGKTATHFKTVQPRSNNMKVKIQHLDPIRVAFMRHVGPYSEVGATWDKFLPTLGKEGLIGGDSRFIGICHDDPEVTPSGKIRYDACLSVDEDFVPQGDIGVQIIAGGDYAVTTHFGPYKNLGKTYARLLGQWLPRSGRELRPTPCFDVYLNDPQSTEPRDLLTDIYAPLIGKSETRNPKSETSNASRTAKAPSPHSITPPLHHSTNPLIQ